MCLFPIQVKSKDFRGFDHVYSVPCGKCVECCKRRQDSWKIRLTEEYRVHKYCYFVTLTYDNDHVPRVFHESKGILSLRKKDVQDWIKRNRIFFGRKYACKIDLKYFVVGEYGPNTVRPHYHAMIFTDLCPFDMHTFVASWRLGFTKLDSISPFRERWCPKCGELRREVCSKAFSVAQFVTEGEPEASDLWCNREIVFTNVEKPWFDLCLYDEALACTLQESISTDFRLY